METAESVQVKQLAKAMLKTAKSTDPDASLHMVILAALILVESILTSQPDVTQADYYVYLQYFGRALGFDMLQLPSFAEGIEEE